MNTRCLLFLAVAFYSLPLAAAEDAGSSFRVGTATRDITPKEAMPMWGYGARHDALSDGVLDPLQANALVLQAGEKKLAIVGLDLGRAPGEQSLQKIRQRIKAASGIEHSFIAGSHTHHGPVLELSDAEGKGKGKFDAALRYYRQLEDAVVEAILEANTNLAPARLAVGSVPLRDFNRNRHTKLQPKSSDRDLAVMRFDDAMGKPRAILVNFAAHPTIQPAKTLKYSADYVGVMKRTVEKEFGATVLFLQGAAGDQSANQNTHKGHEAFGAALGREVIKVVSELVAKPVEAPSLEVKEERFKFTPRTSLANPLARAGFALAFFPELVENYADEYADGVRPRLTVALLNGDLVLVGVSGEFFSNHALRLKERVRGAKQVFFFGYANGYHQYFPTIEAAAEGGYGADSRVGLAEVGAGEQLMNTALMWIYEMLGPLK